MSAAPDHEYIDFVCDGPPSHESGRFVEVEDPSGASIKAGEWINRGGGLWALRVRRPAPAPADLVALVERAKYCSDGCSSHQTLQAIIDKLAKVDLATSAPVAVQVPEDVLEWARKQPGSGGGIHDIADDLVFDYVRVARFIRRVAGDSASASDYGRAPKCGHEVELTTGTGEDVAGTDCWAPCGRPEPCPKHNEPAPEPESKRRVIGESKGNKAVMDRLIAAIAAEEERGAEDTSQAASELRGIASDFGNLRYVRDVCNRGSIEIGRLKRTCDQHETNMAASQKVNDQLRKVLDRTTQERDKAWGDLVDIRAKLSRESYDDESTIEDQAVAELGQLRKELEAAKAKADQEFERTNAAHKDLDDAFNACESYPVSRSSSGTIAERVGLLIDACKFTQDRCDAALERAEKAEASGDAKLRRLIAFFQGEGEPIKGASGATIHRIKPSSKHDDTINVFLCEDVIGGLLAERPTTKTLHASASAEADDLSAENAKLREAGVANKRPGQRRRGRPRCPRGPTKRRRLVEHTTSGAVFNTPR